MPPCHRKGIPVHRSKLVTYVADDGPVVATSSFIKRNERLVKRMYAQMKDAVCGTKEFEYQRRLLSTMTPSEKVAAKDIINFPNPVRSKRKAVYGVGNLFKDRIFNRYNKSARGKMSTKFCQTLRNLKHQRIFDNLYQSGVAKPLVYPFPAVAAVMDAEVLSDLRQSIALEKFLMFEGRPANEYTPLSVRFRDMYKEAACESVRSLPIEIADKVSAFV